MCYAPNKEKNTVINKISRKSEDMKPDKVPWCINLIKDFMRMSILLETIEDMWAYMQNLTKVFGSDYKTIHWFEELNMYLRVKEIKNGFYGYDPVTDDGQ